MGRAIGLATLIAGTLDILFAMALTLWAGRQIPNMLRYVGSGPFPAATEMGAAGAALGLAVHFALMAIMATVFMVVVAEYRGLLTKTLLTGVAYGLITYVVMNWLVVPLRFDVPLPPKPMAIATQLFAHIALVGVPFALIAARTFKTPA